MKTSLKKCEYKKTVSEKIMEQGLNHVFNQNTQILIVGTFPSVQSRNKCYYNNPKNQFWSIMAKICKNDEIIKQDKNKRYDCLLQNGIGLWDIIKSCSFEKASSSDQKIIKNTIVFNDFSLLRTVCPKLKCIVFNSKNACKLYATYLKTIDQATKEWLDQMTDYGAHVLPSTSPANARLKPQDKLKIWQDFFAGYLE